MMTSSASPEAQSQREEQVMELLMFQSDKYDQYQALVLTQLYDFTRGILYLFEKTEQYSQIVRYYMEKKAYKGLISCPLLFPVLTSNVLVMFMFVD